MNKHRSSPLPYTTESIEQQLSELIRAITQTFFEEFAELQATSVINAVDKESVKGDMLELWYSLFSKAIKRYLSTNSSALNEAICKHLGVNFLEDGSTASLPMSFPVFQQMLQVVFLIDGKSQVKKFRGSLHNDHEMRKVVEAVAVALQDLVIVIPLHYYDHAARKRVPDRARKEDDALKEILTRIDGIRERYKLGSPVRELEEAARELMVRIAHADEYIWLPLTSLVTAPLSWQSQEDLKLYQTLTEEESGISSLLTNGERNHISLAYYRSAYQVNVQQGESIEALRHIEAQVGLGVKLGDFLPSTVNSNIRSLLPDIGTNAKASKDWKKQTDQTIALPDYDEDKAEEDVVHLIQMLATPQKARDNKRIKLVFVFDEMDKMEKDKQAELIGRLKNLFLERYTVFLLVTSKEFYYQWLEERKVEDAVLASYFSWIKMVPLFTSEDTVRLLKRLILVDVLHSWFEEEEKFLQIFARYLTYHARGIPRDIVRELQTVQQWMEEDLQPYITNRLDRYNAIQIYAELQDALEGLVRDSRIINYPIL